MCNKTYYLSTDFWYTLYYIIYFRNHIIYIKNMFFRSEHIVKDKQFGVAVTQMED